MPKHHGSTPSLSAASLNRELTSLKERYAGLLSRTTSLEARTKSLEYQLDFLKECLPPHFPPLPKQPTD